MQSPGLSQPLRDCSAICGIYQGHNMAFSEAGQLRGIFAFAYPTDFSGCHRALQFLRHTTNCPCVGPGDTAAIVPTGTGRGPQHPQLRSRLPPSSTAPSTEPRRESGGEKRRHAPSKQGRHCWFIPPESKALFIQDCIVQQTLQSRGSENFRTNTYKPGTFSSPSITARKWNFRRQSHF